MATLGNVRVMRKPALPVLVAAAVAEMINIVPMVSRSVSLQGRMAPPIATVPRAAVICPSDYVLAESELLSSGRLSRTL